MYTSNVVLRNIDARVGRGAFTKFRQFK